MITIEVWHNQELHDDYDYSSEENQQETIERFAEWLGALEETGAPGDSFTLIARQIG